MTATKQVYVNRYLNIRACVTIFGIFHNEGLGLFSARSTGWTDAKVCSCRRLENLMWGGKAVVVHSRWGHAGAKSNGGVSEEVADWRHYDAMPKTVALLCFPFSHLRPHLSYGWHWHCARHRFVLQRRKNESRVIVYWSIGGYPSDLPSDAFLSTERIAPGWSIRNNVYNIKNIN